MAGSACLPAITDPSAPSISPPFVLHQITASPCSRGFILPSCLPGSFFFLLFLNFSHLDGYCLSPSHSRCDSGCVCHPCQLSGLGYAPSPTAVLPRYWSNRCGPATKPWLLPKTRKPHGAPVLAMPGSPGAAFSSLIFFVSQDLMHYSALRTLRGVGKIMVLQKGTGSPCRCWIFLSWADFPLQH